CSSPVRTSPGAQRTPTLSSAFWSTAPTSLSQSNANCARRKTRSSSTYRPLARPAAEQLGASADPSVHSPPLHPCRNARAVIQERVILACMELCRYVRLVPSLFLILIDRFVTLGCMIFGCVTPMHHLDDHGNPAAAGGGLAGGG